MDEYKKILDEVNKQQERAQDDYKMYRYSGLLHAIEFFSQRFALEEIVNHVFEFTNELIVSNNIVVLIRDDNDYMRPRKIKGYKKTPEIKGKDMDQIVYFHAGILNQETLKEFFTPELIDVYNPGITLQLIMDKKLYGLIFLQRSGEEYSVDDKIIANALMNLFYTSLTNYQAYTELEETQKILDEKIFNLFAINYSSKALLSELDRQNLNQLSISVFSELTQSAITGMFTFDNKSETYRLIQMQDVFHPERELQCVLYPKEKTNYGMTGSVVDWQDEAIREGFMDHFENSHDIFENLKPRYIITINNGKELLAFISLSDKVNDDAYKPSEFELIESLVSSTYIAMSNADRLQEVVQTRQKLDGQLENMMRLNNLMKNLNSAVDEESLVELLTATLSLSFGFEKLFFAKACSLKENHGYDMTYVNTNDVLPDKILPIELDTRLMNNASLYLYTSEQVEDFLSGLNIYMEDKDFKGMIIVPLTIEKEEVQVIGFLGVWEVDEGNLFDPEKILVIESIVSHVSPVLYQLMTKEYIEKTYQPNYYESFARRLDEELQEASELHLPLYVFLISAVEKIRFSPIRDSLEIPEDLWELNHVFPIDYQNILCLSDDPKEIEQIEAREPINSKLYTYRKDFLTRRELFAALAKK